MDTGKTTAAEARPRPEARRHPRYRLLRDLWIKSPTCGVRKAHTVDISESGLSALLDVEIPLNEFVELQFTVPAGNVTIYATVRQHQAFRYGFEFSSSKRAQGLIKATCEALEKQGALKAGND